MNRLPTEKRAQMLHMLVEGCSMRSVSRMAGVSINTVTKLLRDAGQACAEFHDAYVRGIRARRVECDEIWAFYYQKKKTAAAKGAAMGGDVWTWTAFDPDSKLLIAWLVSPGRETQYAREFMADLRDRLANRVQLSTDGHAPYLEAVADTFGADVDYARVVKEYENDHIVGSSKETIEGTPDIRSVSTSLVERNNYTIRMANRRFTRLTNAFSKRIEHHWLQLALYFVYYNWCRAHGGLNGKTPAMAAGLAPRPFGIRGIVEMVDRRAPAHRRGPYRRRGERQGRRMRHQRARRRRA